MPKIHRASRWLAETRYRERLETDDANTPNRLLFDGLAFGLSGALAGDDELRQQAGSEASGSAVAAKSGRTKGETKVSNKAMARSRRASNRRME